MHTIKNTFLIIIVLLITTSCDSYKRLAQERAEKAASNKEFFIAIVDSLKTTSLFHEGINLAIKEINESGGLLGKPLTPIYYDDNLDPVQGQNIANSIVKNTDIIAVIGHRHSNVAIPVSITYEQSGLLFISTGATKPEFTQYSGSFTFRNIPSDQISGKAAALFIKDKGYKKVLTILDQDSGASQLVKIFNAYAIKNKIKIVAEKTYSDWETDFRLLIASIIKEYEFDCIFLGGDLPAVANIIKQMREMGIDKPIIGNESLDSQQLWEIAGKAAEGTIVFTVFDPNLPETATQNFVETFKAEYGLMPDTLSAQGYDAIKVFSHAVEKSGTAVPMVAGNTLRLVKNWKGVTGQYSFDWDGGITGKSVFFKQAKNQRFEFLHNKSRDKINLFNPLEEITLRIPSSEKINTIDPGLAVKDNEIEVVEQLFLALTDFDPETYEVVPELAKEWTATKDYKKYVFRIREDIKWTNSEKVTAHDIVWAIRRNLNPLLKSPNINLLSVIKNAKAFYEGKINDVSKIGVRALEDFLIEFELESPAPYFPSWVSFPPFCPLPRKAIQKKSFKLTEHFFDKIQEENLPSDLFYNLKKLKNNEYDTQSELVSQLKATIGEDQTVKYKPLILKHAIYNWTTPENIITNGSYMLAAWEKGIAMVLRKNQSYYQADKVFIPELRYYVVPSSLTGLIMYNNKTIDILGGNYPNIPLTELGKIQTNKAFADQYSKDIQFSGYAYGFNVNKPPMNNRLVRKAIGSCIDKDLLIKLAMKGDKQKAETFTPPDILGTKEKISIKLDPVMGAKWLNEAGYPDGRGFPVITLLYNNSEIEKKAAESVSSLLKYHLNITVKIIGSDDDISKFSNKKLPHIFAIKLKNYDTLPGSIIEQYFDPMITDNYTGFKDTDFVKLMERIIMTSDVQEEKKLCIKAEKILCNTECLVIPIYFDTAHYLVNTRVKGWYHMPIGGQHIRDWSLKQQ